MKKEPLKVIAGAPDRPLVIGNIEIPCYVLEDETRVLSQRGVTEGIGLNPEAGFRMPQFMASRTINRFVPNDLVPALNSPVRFKNPAGGGNAHGYPATILADICEAVLDAKESGALRVQQEHIAKRCKILMRGFSRVGIIALVDEVTGYQRIREKRALATILERWVVNEKQPWTRTFPYEFYEQIFRLKGWPGPEGVKRPSVIGTYTNDLVYYRLAPGVLDELRRLTPKLPSGNRRNKFFQWFTPDFGHPRLKEHLAAVTALMRAAPNWDSFIRNLQRAFPRFQETIPLPLNEEDYKK